MKGYATIINHPVEIIVGTVLDGRWNWYVSERDYWFLDLRKLGEAFGKGPNPRTEGRFGIDVVDANNAQVFLKAMDRFHVTTEDLCTLFRDKIPAQAWDDVIDFVPSLLVDFDRSVLMSLYGEPASFERYVPDGWHGAYDDFLPLVPHAERYWIVGGRDWFAELMNEAG